MNNNLKHSSKSITPPKKTDPIYNNLSIGKHYSYNVQKITTGKDQRLEFVEISKGLIEVLQKAGFTIEKILDSMPSEIAEKLGIDNYVAELIHNETKKAISIINPDTLISNK